MEPLFRMGADDSLIPVLGLTAELSDGDKLWTIKLRQGVRFQDGAPFDADAVVRHWQRVLDPQNKYRGRAALSVIESVEKEDDYTVRFGSSTPGFHLNL